MTPDNAAAIALTVNCHRLADILADAVLSKQIIPERAISQISRAIDLAIGLVEGVKEKTGNLIRDEDGVIMIEAILVLPIMIALTFGGIQWGLLSMAQAGLNTATASVAYDWAAGTINSESAAEAALADRVHEVVGWVPVDEIAVSETSIDGDVMVAKASVPGIAAGVLGLVPSPQILTAAALVTRQTQP